MDTEAYKIQPARLSYEVRYGDNLSDRIAFASFELALAFYRGYNIGNNYAGHADDGPTLVNADNIDGADDSSPAAQRGLTQAEFDAVEEAG